MGRLVALLAGALFGAGLLIAGMTRPAKVLGFLDLTGRWDPSLAFVMVGAIGLHAVLFRVITRRRSPLLEAQFELPTKKDVDAPLLIGAALFGVGWGLGGYCPGPALVSVGGGSHPALAFGVAMIVGVLIHRALKSRLG